MKRLQGLRRVPLFEFALVELRAGLGCMNAILLTSFGSGCFHYLVLCRRIIKPSLGGR